MPTAIRCRCRKAARGSPVSGVNEHSEAATVAAAQRSAGQQGLSRRNMEALIRGPARSRSSAVSGVGQVVNEDRVRQAHRKVAV